MSKNSYEIVAQSIIAQLENNVAPWRKEWVASGYTPTSLSSKKRYNGINHWLLSFAAMGNGYESPWWGTYKQVSELGGSVLKGSKGTPVVLWKQFDTKDADGNDKKAIVMRYFTVFNAEQAEWLNQRRLPDNENRGAINPPDSDLRLLREQVARALRARAVDGLAQTRHLPARSSSTTSSGPSGARAAGFGGKKS